MKGLTSCCYRPSVCESENLRCRTEGVLALLAKKKAPLVRKKSHKNSSIIQKGAGDIKKKQGHKKEGVKEPWVYTSKTKR